MCCYIFYIHYFSYCAYWTNFYKNQLFVNILWPHLWMIWKKSILWLPNSIISAKGTRWLNIFLKFKLFNISFRNWLSSINFFKLILARRLKVREANFSSWLNCQCLFFKKFQPLYTKNASYTNIIFTELLHLFLFFFKLFDFNDKKCFRVLMREHTVFVHC